MRARLTVYLRKTIPAPALCYLAALAGLAVLTGAAAALIGVSGRSLAIVRIFSLLYIVLILGSAWTGFGPGLVVSLLVIFVVPVALRSPGGPRWPPDAFRVSLILCLSLVVSAIGRWRRGVEKKLRRGAEELGERVRARTEEVVRAVHERELTEESAREQTQLLDLAHDGILAMDERGIIRFWNRGAEEIYGWKREEAVGKVCHDLLKAVFPEPLAEIQAMLFASGRWEGELVHTRRDGTQIRVMSRWAMRRDASGTARGYLEIVTDITEKRRIEEQLRHTQKLESLGVLAGGVAHDFNNLLTGMLGNASLALDTLPENHPNRILLEEVTRAAERAADLTRQLLAYAGKGRFVLRVLDLSELVREIGGLVQASIPKQVQLRLQLADDLPGIEADPGQIQQIVMNLVINGAEAIGEEGGMVLVRTGVQQVDEQYIDTVAPSGETLKPGEYVSLEVHDTGCGMSEETLGKIFDPFFTTKFAGRGLGLSAVQGIVRAHQGALKVYSKPGSGTTFKVLFRSAGAPVAPQPAPEHADLRGSGAVLVVDDESIVRETVRHTLERYGYDVLVAKEGAEAIEIFRQRRDTIRVVLLDLTMPGMSGEQTLRELQRLQPGVKVLLSSGYNEVEALHRFAGKGLAGFIQKPYTAAALAGKVRDALKG